MGGEFGEVTQRSPFEVSPPASITQSVCTLLANDNARQAQDHVRARVTEPHRGTVPGVRPKLVKLNGESIVERDDQQTWSIGPQPEWFRIPIWPRPNIGRELVDRVVIMSQDEPEQYGQNISPMDTWSCPFIVSYLMLAVAKIK